MVIDIQNTFRDNDINNDLGFLTYDNYCTCTFILGISFFSLYFLVGVIDFH